MAKDISQLPNDIMRTLNAVGFREACMIVDSTLEETDKVVPASTTSSWRLIDSGFGYVNGKLVAETDQGRSTSNYGIDPPDTIHETHPPHGHYDITISYHTPKLATENARVTKMYKGRRVFDYAPYVLEGGIHEYMIRTMKFTSRRVAALKGMAKKVGSTFSPTQLSAAIERGMERGLTRAAQSIVNLLSDL